MVREKQRTSRPLASLHVREILGADELRERLADGKEERLRRAPSPHHLELERRVFTLLQNDPPEGLVAFHQAVQRLQLK